MKLYKSLSLFLVVVLFQSCYSQQLELTTKNKRAEKVFRQGLELYNNYEPQRAKSQFLRAIEIDSLFVEAYQLVGSIFEEEKNYEKAIEYYEKSIEVDPDFFSNTFYLVANLYLKDGIYEKALSNLNNFIKYKNISHDLREEAYKKINNCEVAIELMKNPVPFEPKNLGTAINTSNSEYSPTLTADEQILYFTVSRPRDQYTLCETCKEEEDFYISFRKDGEWLPVRPFGKPVNTHGNEGAASISPDGMYFYFTACNRSDGYGSCDIYYSKREKGQWTVPVNMGPVVNGPYWDSQPTLAPDGKTLYLASARNGQMDIFVTVKDDDGKWGEPICLRKPVNTDKAEMTPFIHPDGKTLYFTSNGHPGMGGFDIFYSQKQDDGTWSEPENLGYPINTHKDEGFFIVNALGDKAYFATDQLGGYGKMDLYVFNLHESARPTSVTYLKGIVTNKSNNNRISANFELFDIKTGNLVVNSRSDEVNGEFLVCLPTNKNYALYVSKDGYLFYSENFALKGQHSKLKPYKKNIELQPIIKDEIVILRNIFFDFDKDILKNESVVELYKLLNLLNKNNTMAIEIRGHTDSFGLAEYNKRLSQNRALAVYNYLIEKGIDKNRLSYKGFGAEEPIDTNETEEGRANNRRTEFRVLSVIF